MTNGILLGHFLLMITIQIFLLLSSRVPEMSEPFVVVVFSNIVLIWEITAVMKRSLIDISRCAE